MITVTLKAMYLDSEDQQWGNEPVLLYQQSLIFVTVWGDRGLSTDSDMDLIMLTTDDGHFTSILCLLPLLNLSTYKVWILQTQVKPKEAEWD